jgi:two-component system nitrogen regulation sensor histidine kinase NtrY
MLNLVDNAVEAVSGTGVVELRTEYLAEPGRVRLTVSDNGPGIPSEDRDKLFLPYFSTKVTGMGLGLPIVSEIVCEHGGVIRVEDNHPSGTRFVVDVPVSRTPATVEA